MRPLLPVPTLLTDDFSLFHGLGAATGGGPYKSNVTALLPILWTVFETEAQTLILPLAFDLTEKAQTRILLLVIENCRDYCLILVFGFL